MIPSILICGKTGAGKTSLIQALSSKEVVPDGAIGHFEPTTRGFVLYRTPVANFIDCEGMEPGQTTGQYADFILREVQTRLERGEAEHVVTGIFYCIDGSGGRIQRTDADLVDLLDERVNVVLTKSDLIREKQLENMTRELGELVPPERIFVISSSGTLGLARLQERICEMAKNAMEEANEKIGDFKTRWEGYYREKLAVWENSSSREADVLIRRAVWRAAAIAMLPFVVDIFLQNINELYLIHCVGGVYGYSVSRKAAGELSRTLGVPLPLKIVSTFLLVFKIAIFPFATRRAGEAVKAHFASGAKESVREELRAEFRQTELSARRRRGND